MLSIVTAALLAGAAPTALAGRRARPGRGTRPAPRDLQCDSWLESVHIQGADLVLTKEARDKGWCKNECRDMGLDSCSGITFEYDAEYSAETGKLSGQCHLYKFTSTTSLVNAPKRGGRGDYSWVFCPSKDCDGVTKTAKIFNFRDPSAITLTVSKAENRLDCEDRCLENYGCNAWSWRIKRDRCITWNLTTGWSYRHNRQAWEATTICDRLPEVPPRCKRGDTVIKGECVTPTKLSDVPCNAWLEKYHIEDAELVLTKEARDKGWCRNECIAMGPESCSGITFEYDEELSAETGKLSGQCHLYKFTRDTVLLPAPEGDYSWVICGGVSE